MINFSLNVSNPYSNKFINLWSKNINTPFEHKFIELECYKDSSVVSLNFNYSVQQSHAGLDFEIGLLGFCFHFNFYDSRHWDYLNHCWVNYNA